MPGYIEIWPGPQVAMSHDTSSFRKATWGGSVIDTYNSATTLERPQAGRLPIEMSQEEVNELFAACLPKLQKAARKMFRNEQDSEDALQEALLLAFRKMHQFEGRSSFSTWVHSIVRNTSRMYYRRAKAHPAISTDQDHLTEEGAVEESAFVDQRPTPEEAYVQQERSEILQKAAHELPEKYHAAIYLFYSRGLGEEATAKALGITVSALKAQLHRSRILLSYRIRKTCMPDVRRELLRARPFLRKRPMGRLRSRRTASASSSRKLEAMLN